MIFIKDHRKQVSKALSNPGSRYKH